MLTKGPGEQRGARARWRISLNKSRAENAELQRKVKEFEARLAELENTDEVESTDDSEKAAA